MRNINIREIPELKTRVGMHGSSSQKEVGGPACLAVIAAVIYSSG
jgi:hypothetical protein